jgi:hypothetical protein
VDRVLVRWASKSADSAKVINFKANKPQLDWRSVTSINETARLIRRDVRKKKISYYLGMSILIRARDQLATLIRNPMRDRRLAQINHEIRVTKKLLKDQFGNANSVQQYKLMLKKQRII